MARRRVHCCILLSIENRSCIPSSSACSTPSPPVCWCSGAVTRPDSRSPVGPTRSPTASPTPSPSLGPKTVAKCQCWSNSKPECWRDIRPEFRFPVRLPALPTLSPSAVPAPSPSSGPTPSGPAPSTRCCLVLFDDRRTSKNSVPYSIFDPCAPNGDR